MQKIKDNLYRIENKDLPETYIFHSTASSKIVTDQSLSGHELHELAVNAASSFLELLG